MRGFFQSNQWTKWAGIIVLLAILFTVFENKSWENPKGVIQSDIKGYYGYLPALFIHQDLSLENTKDYDIGGELKLWYTETDDGQRFIKFPTGMAILYSPFFAIAHTTSEWFGYPANGYSLPYRFALVMGSLVYLIIGLVFFARLMLLHFSDRVTAITMIILYLGTNLYYYIAYDGVFTHGHTFALFSAFLYGSIQWVRHQKWKHVVLLSVSGGLMVAVRHIDLLFLPVLLVYGVRTLGDFKQRLSLFWSKKIQVLAGIGLITLMLTPQLAYHWYVSGNIFHYSYDEERFFFGAPNLFDSVLSYRNGWLVYSPIMIFSVIGLFFLKKRAPESFVASLFSLPLYYYILASWWCWWFVGFGNRAYINMYPLLAFSLASFVVFVRERHRLLNYGFNMLVLGAIVLNFFQSWQFKEGVIHWDSETKEHYWHIFGRSHRSQVQDLFLASPDMEAAKKGEDFVYTVDLHVLSQFEEGFEAHYAVEPYNYSHVSPRQARTGNYGLFVPVNQEFGGQLRFKVPHGTSHVYASVWVKTEGKPVLSVGSTGQDAFLHGSDDVVEEKDGWKKLEILGLPNREIDYDTMLLYVWNRDKLPLAIDDFKVSCSYSQLRRTRVD